jgi:voltage-gated sodium channel
MNRAALAAFVEHPRFQNFILAVIVFNAIILGLETSATAMAHAGELLILLDTIALSIFVVEIGLKLLAFRLAFFRSGWNVFDFLIVAISLAPATEGFAVLRALRILRVLGRSPSCPRSGGWWRGSSRRCRAWDRSSC